MRIHSLTYGASPSGSRRPGVEYDVDEGEGSALVASKAAREVKVQTAIDPAPKAAGKTEAEREAETVTNPAPAKAETATAPAPRGRRTGGR